MLLLPLTAPRLALAAQLVRFGLTGSILAILTAVTYLVPAVLLGVPPLIANFLAYCVAATAGFWLHGHLSFAGHGSRDQPARRGARFIAVSLTSLALNSLFVWTMTGPMRLSPAWPIVPMLCVTPLVTFWLHRQWVYR